NGNKKLISKAVNFNIKKASDSIASIKIDKRAKGNSYENAKNNATAISYSYSLNNKHLKFNNYSVSDIKNRFKDQQIDIDVYVAEGQVVNFDESTKYSIGYRTENDKGLNRSDLIKHYWI